MFYDEGRRFRKILIGILKAAGRLSLCGITRKRSFKKLAAVLSFTLLFLAAGAVSRVVGQEGLPGTASLEERESALSQQAGLDEQEKALVVELLDWDVRIESARLEQERLQREIPLLEELLAASEVQLGQSRVQLEQGYARLGQWLDHLYRHGFFTYMDVVLGSADFTEFVERAEMVGMIVNSQLNILDEVQSFAVAVREQAAAVRQTRDDLSAKSAELAVRLREMETARAGREEFLAALRQESSSLAARVVQAETQWYRSLNSLHYLIANLNSLPLYTLSPDKTELTRSGLRLEFSDQELNRKLAEMGDANLAGFSVRCYPGRFTVAGPAAYPGGPDFVVEGFFVMAEDKRVRFQPENLTLAGAPVSREVLGYLASEGGMVIDYGAYLETFRLSAIDIEEGKIVITLSFK
jgi:peptidoglycan hydrolase CwlO-like protein